MKHKVSGYQDTLLQTGAEPKFIQSVTKVDPSDMAFGNPRLSLHFFKMKQLFISLAAGQRFFCHFCALGIVFGKT